MYVCAGFHLENCPGGGGATRGIWIFLRGMGGGMMVKDVTVSQMPSGGQGMLECVCGEYVCRVSYRILL